MLEQMPRLVMHNDNYSIGGTYFTCFEHGCFADFVIESSAIERMKKVRTISIEATRLNKDLISISVPLDDFAEVYGSDGVDADAYEREVLNERKRKSSLIFR